MTRQGTPPELSAFEGTWDLSRRITGPDGAETARLEGTAAFLANGLGLKLTETGVLTTGGASVEASRTYFWRPGPDGIEVLFDDGSPFHTIGALPDVHHDCAPDTYHGTYDFSDWPRWSLTWRVTGPRKDYISTSRYCAQPGSRADRDAVSET
ncbi:MAG: DUF6314 family protein [Pseudomonadota bacterium]